MAPRQSERHHMSLQFYLGRAGSGKTSRCIRDIAQRLQQDPAPSAPRLICLVPEQAAAQTERAILEQPQIPGFTRLHILSFRSLARLALERSAPSLAPLLSEEARLMLLTAVVARNRQHLKFFARASGELGFISRLAATLREIRQYRHSFVDMEAQAKSLTLQEKGESLLAIKLREIALLGRAWEQEIADRFANPDNLLDELAIRLADSRFFENAEVWIDSFAGFTPQEMRIIQVIMEQAAAVRIALLLDPQSLPQTNPRSSEVRKSPKILPPTSHQQSGDPIRLFSETEETYLRIAAIAIDNSIEILPPVLLPETEQPTRFVTAPWLCHLEEKLAGSGLLFGSPREATSGPSGITAHPPTEPGALPSPLPPLVCMEAPNRRDEVEAVARAIRRLCREENEQYRHIAVLMRDLEPYHSLIRSTFAAHQIPCFIDQRHPVAHHPLVEILSTAIRIARGEWMADDVLQYLKNDLAPVTRAESDRIENMALRTGITGRNAWLNAHKPFSRNQAAYPVPKPEGMAPSLEKALRPLFQLEQSLGLPSTGTNRLATSVTASRFVQSIAEFLQKIQSATRMEQWEREAREAGNIETAMEHEQAWNAVMALLQQMADAIGPQEASFEELARVLETGLASLTLGIVPPALDQVLVGAVDRSRQPELTTLFLLGMNEGDFPKIPRQDAIFLDAERRALAQSGIEMAPSSDIRMFRERLLAYIAMTRPSRRLIVSYAAADSSGKALQQSPFISILEAASASCNPPLMSVRLSSQWLEQSMDAIENPNQAMEAALRESWNTSPEPSEHDINNRAAWTALKASLAQDPSLGKRLQQLVAANAAQKTASLSTGIAHPLLQINRPVSASRLESYAQCPFRYFADHILRLAERERFQIRPLDLGIYHHDVLSEVFTILVARHPAPLPAPSSPLFPAIGLDWGKISESEAIDDALNEALKKHIPEILSQSAIPENQADFLVARSRRILSHALRTFIMQGAQDKFVQAAAEWAFGIGAPRSSPPLQIPLSNNQSISLRGRIDRIDLAPAPAGKCLARIYDFKSSNKTLDLSDIEDGLALQLPLYLRALVQASHARLVAAGAFYFPLRLEIQKRDAPPSPGQSEPFTPLRALGMVSSNALPAFGDIQPGTQSPFIRASVTKKGMLGSINRTDCLDQVALESICDMALQAAARISEQILQGSIPVYPYRKKGRMPCSYCPHSALCRITPRHSEVRELPTRSRTQVIQSLQ